MKDKTEIDIASLLKELQAYDNPSTEKQRHILEAAAEVFGEKGYDAAPTAEIARRAGVTERTLFKHFKSKSALLKRVVFAFAVKTILPLQIQKVKAMSEREAASYADFVAALAKDRLATVRSFGMGPRIVFNEILRNEGFRDKIRELFKDNVWTAILAAVKRFQQQNKLRKDLNPEAIARATMTMVAGYVLFRSFIANKEDWDDEKNIESLVRVLTEGVNPR